MPATKPEVAQRRIEFFGKRFGEAHLYLAYHAAFPLALTPDLLYRLWANFQCDIHGEVLDIPWIAVSDLLLSSLCKEVGYELYEMDQATRDELLKGLEANSRLGKKRLNELSAFLLAYVEQQLQSKDPDERDFAEAQRWTALAYVRPGEVARELTFALQKVYGKDKIEHMRLVSILETLAMPLEGFQPLLTYARGENIYPHFSFETVTVNERGEVINRQTLQAQFFQEDLGNQTILEMVAIPGGSFWMGSPEGEGDSDEHPQHKVTVESFFLSKYPITQKQWRAVAALPEVKHDLEREPSQFSGDNLPVETVSWYQAVEFCARLTIYTGKNYRLPSEAEWEYACRAGTTTPFHFGETITTDLANYNGNYTYGKEPKGKYRDETTPVGHFQVANGFGLYDMHGNVYQWCENDWHKDYQGAPTDGSAWLSSNNTTKVIRGGSWLSLPWYCRCAFRRRFNPDSWDSSIGLRVGCSVARILP